MTILTCPICGKPLDLTEKTRRCPAGHSFDRAAKGGYVHLLRQSRKGSAHPGDSPEMCRMRTQFLEAGYYAPLKRQVYTSVTALAPRAVLDAGCGEGYYTAAIWQALEALGGERALAGIDLAKTALRHTAKLCPQAELAVASILALPVRDGSLDLVTHLFAPPADREFARVLRPGGALLTVRPGARHLWGLKEQLYEKPYENPTDVRDIPGFVHESRICVEDCITVRGGDIAALFRMTPYAWKTGREAAERLLALPELVTEISFLVDVHRRQ
jgi:23S rRNA (guanine745-N1)-methyltransferase